MTDQQKALAAELQYRRDNFKPGEMVGNAKDENENHDPSSGRFASGGGGGGSKSKGDPAKEGRIAAGYKGGTPAEQGQIAARHEGESSKKPRERTGSWVTKYGVGGKPYKEYVKVKSAEEQGKEERERRQRFASNLENANILKKR